MIVSGMMLMRNNLKLMEIFNNMRKSIILIGIIICLTNFISFGQSYKQIYLQDYYSLYKSSYLMVDSNHIGGLKIFKDINLSNVVSSEKIIGKVLFVSNIIDGKYQSEYDINNEKIFCLLDTLNKQTFYYKTRPRFITNGHGFPFLTTLIKYENLCDKIITKVDDFTNEIKISTPLTYLINKQNLTKNINGIDTTYYLSLTAYGNTVNVGGKGVIILFDDGTKFEKPNEKVDVKVGEEDYEYSCFIRLTKDEVHLFSEKKY